MPGLTITLFGPPRLALDGAPVDIGRDKSLALLAYLCLTKGPQRRDRLAALLWPETSQSSARAYVRNALYALTRKLGDRWFEADRSQIALRPDSGIQVDVWEFQKHIDAAQAGDDWVRHLTEAAELAGDEFLAGFSLADAPEFEQWQLFQWEGFQRQLDEVLQTLVHHHQTTGDYTQAIGHARRWVALDPLNETAHWSLMRLFALSGQRASALRHYDELAQLLHDELDALPSEEVDTLYTEIREDRLARRDAPSIAAADTRMASGDGGTFGPGETVARDGAVPHNLPQPPTPFVGREQELADLDRLLDDGDARLITILGPGGMGKTRLALACARRQLQNRRFAGGVYFVALAALDDPGRIALTIANAVGYRPGSRSAGDRSLDRQLVDFLRDRQMLVILDNMEHLLAGTGLLGEILQAAPEVRLLVTSRERLRLRAEHGFPIQGLPYAEPAQGEAAANAAAIRLFEQSARRSAAGFSLAGEDLEHAAEICRLVEGMPLGIELAASWVHLMTSAEIAQEIRDNLTFLHTELRDVPERHHSIRAVFDTTWQRLEESEQAVFAALSVFRGGFDREAARAVADAGLDQLRSLADKSLIQPVRHATGQHRRYTIQEVLRQYGALMLAGSPDWARRAHDRHCNRFTGFLEARLPTINGPDQRKAADEIALEIDNVRAAWRWAVIHADAAAILRAATTLFLFCQIRSHFLEGAEMMAAAAGALQAGASSALRDQTLAQLLDHEGWLRIRVGDFDRAAAALEASLRLYAQAHVPPPAPYLGTDPAAPLSIVTRLRGDFSRARELGETALRSARARNDWLNQGHAHYALTSLSAAQGDYVAAAYHAERACALALAAGNRWFLATPLTEWGKVARAVEDYAQARQHFRASYAIKREFGDPEGMAIALSHLGEIAALQQDLDEAARLYRQALAIYQGLSDRVGLATVWFGLGQVARAQGATAVAAERFRQALDVAWETQFLPLLFSVLIDAGCLLLSGEHPMTGMAALMGVKEHEAADYETKSRAARHLDRWRADVDPALSARTRSQDLETVVTTVGLELAAIMVGVEQSGDENAPI